jgi:hypothetical protein
MKIRPIHVLAAILALASVYFYQDPGANGNSRLAMTRAVVERGTFQIDAYHNKRGWETKDEAFYNGHTYTDKAIGSSLLAVPPYFLLIRLTTALGILPDSAFVKHFLTTLVMGSGLVILGLILYWSAEAISRNVWKSFIVALVLSLGTMLWPFSIVYFGHVVAAMFLSAAFLLMFRSRSAPGPARGWLMFLPGLMLGAAFITDYTSALIIVGLMAYGLYILRGLEWRIVVRAGFAGALGALLPLSLMFAYNLVVYGSILAFGYSHETEPRFQLGHTTGFFGISPPDAGALYHLTIDPKFGLFWQSPVLVLGLVGAAWAFRRKLFRLEVLLALFAIISILLMNAGYYTWWGGSTFGPRFLIVALPFFVIPLALVPDRLLWLMVSLGIVSAAQMLIPLMGSVQIGLDFDAVTNQFLINKQPFTDFSLLYQAALPLATETGKTVNGWWDLGWALGWSREASLGAFILGEALLIAWLRRRVAAEEQPATGNQVVANQ